VIELQELPEQGEEQAAHKQDGAQETPRVRHGIELGYEGVQFGFHVFGLF